MITLILTVALLVVPQFSSTQGASNWRTYQGAWFEIKYPANFGVRPSLSSGSSNQWIRQRVLHLRQTEASSFTCFSPQWNSSPSDIELNPQTEVLVAQDIA